MFFEPYIRALLAAESDGWMQRGLKGTDSRFVVDTSGNSRR